MLPVVLAVLLLLSLSSVATADPVAVNTVQPVAATPPMGFNNWARFQCLPQAPVTGRDLAHYSFQAFMLDQGKALVATGLAEVGYRTVVVDDCWMERGEDGELHGIAQWGSYKHPSRQPGFENDLTAYMDALHVMGLRGGVYNTSGKTTCQKVAAGEEGHQDRDARRFAGWGVDFLKLDNCGASDDDLPDLFRKMSDALGRATAGNPRKILFDESAPAQYAPNDPMKYQSMAWVRPLGQMWRVAPDIRVTHVGTDGRSLYDPWSFNDAAQGYEEGVYQAYTDAVALSRFVAAGNWNDADQLLIGDNGLTTAEERSQMGLWSMLGAPLIISADLRAMEANVTEPHFAAALDILRNKRAIAIDQDPLAAGGYRVLRDSSADDMGVDVVVKPLADGGLAFLVLNKGPIGIDYTLPLSRLGVSAKVPCPFTLTDVWSGQVQTRDAQGSLAERIGSHDSLMMRVAPAACATLTATGQIAVAQAEFAGPPLCLDVGESGVVTTQACSGSKGQQWSMQPDGYIRQMDTHVCLGSDLEAAVRVSPCGAAPTEPFRYHRSGALMAGNGRCLGVETAKVGHGGLIGQQGAHLKVEPCRDFAPDQVFSAPHLGSPPV